MCVSVYVRVCVCVGVGVGVGVGVCVCVGVCVYVIGCVTYGVGSRARSCLLGRKYFILSDMSVRVSLVGAYFI